MVVTEVQAAEQQLEMASGAGQKAAAQAHLKVKRTRLQEAEAEAGRMGGGSGPQITYDEAAIDRLLDRQAPLLAQNPLLLPRICKLGMCSVPTLPDS